MSLRRSACLFLLVCLAPLSGSAHNPALSKLPVTTSSAAARKRFDRAMEDLECLRQSQAVEGLQQAVKLDPKFTQAWIMLAHISHDPEEQQSARSHAKQTAAHATFGEGLLVRWLAGVQEDDYVPAIAAMNDLLSRFPQDQRLNFLAGAWLLNQQRYAQSIVILEKAIKLDPNYAAAVNELAYAYAFSGDFEHAFSAMDRYVALQPNEPNPHDSYGEILRLAGKFDAALEQYRQSIRIDPNFGSELGVADTYAVMGKEQEAREEYDRAIVFSGSTNDKVQYSLQSAVTWIRENNRKQAEHALREVAKHAHAVGLARWEAEAHRVLAMYEPDPKEALKQLQAAESALAQPRGLSRSDQAEEQARILQIRAMRQTELQPLDAAKATVQQLEKMAASSRSQVIQLAYHSAAGAVLLGEGKFSEAVPHLEEDSSDPLSMKLLWKAYNATGATQSASEVAAKLAALNAPTTEQALVVPQFRASMVSQVQQP